MASVLLGVYNSRMSDEEAFLAAIAEQPDEDTPRLAYADWLDEHDRAIRAEFLRLQIEIARKETLPRVIQNRYVDLWKRNQELLDGHRKKLLGSLAKLPATVKIEFRRGFVSEITLTCDQFDTFGFAIAKTLPLPRVTVIDTVSAVQSFVVDGVPDGPHEIVAGIRTHPNQRDGEFEGLPRILAGNDRPHTSRSWPRLQELDMSGCQLGHTAFSLFVHSASLPMLTDLDVSVNELFDSSVVTLLNTSLPRQLKRLILGGNALTDQAAIELADRWPRGAGDQLEHLNLRFTMIGVPGQQALLARFGGRVDLF